MVLTGLSGAIPMILSSNNQGYPMLNRRQFLQQSFATGLAFSSLARALGAMDSTNNLQPAAPAPWRAEALRSDPNGLLALPPDFSYRIVSQAGEKMDDGFFVPGAMDSMGCFAAPNGDLLLARNHELTVPGELGISPFGKNNELLDLAPLVPCYDSGRKGPLLGGVTILRWSPHNAHPVKQHLALSGTIRNCSGGTTPWGTWLSCEENTEVIGTTCTKNHGYVFEVGLDKPSFDFAHPLIAMGRFNHEAAVVDPHSGIVYLTEDRWDGLFYRFIPKQTGDLKQGGQLQALLINDALAATTGKGFLRGEQHACRWINIDNPQAPRDDLRLQGINKGCAQFVRGEGLFMGQKGLYFTATAGGAKQLGQVWHYTPSPNEGHIDESKTPGQLTLFAESQDPAVLQQGDNLCVSPWGDCIICEDHHLKTRGNRLVGINAAGAMYSIAENQANGSELAGACFSPDGRTLFVNIMYPGITIAITGPWPQV